MFGFFKEKEKEKNKVEIHNHLIDIRIGRKYARGNNMDGNAYECFDKTAEDVYTQYSDDLKAVNKLCFIEGYDSQKEELLRVLKHTKR